MPIRSAIWTGAAVFLGWSAVAHAGTPALVVDAASGKVLLSERATDPWFPASITKLMTTYVALDLVRQGRFSMSSLVTMSPDAAAEPPSKMGFKPGTQLTLENALKIIMVKSANDVSYMIAENLAGSVDGFAALMNAASRRLGMHESRWFNANGLPDDRQQTSARDMAILARALINEFPEQEGLFHIGALKLGRKVIRNHNGLLGRYPGADGMKTGFICSGGFNVVATATQNGRRLITVVMGYPTARERDLRAADLFDQGFTSVGWGGQQLEQLPPSAAMAPPNVRSFVCGPNKRIPQEDDETAKVAAAGGNADNPVASLFAPLAFSAASASAVPSLGRRTSLGPRVAFEPVPIWLGASPGSTPDEADPARKTKIAAKPVRTKLVAQPVPGASGSVTLSPTVPPSTSGEGERIETVKAKPRPGSRAALSAHLVPKPAAEAKPKLGSVGQGSGRVKHGAIAIKGKMPASILATTALPERQPAKPAGKAAAKGGKTAAKTAAAPKRAARSED